MFNQSFSLLLAPAALLFTSSVFAGESDFHAGTAIPDFGKVATINSDLPILEGTVFKVSFDISKQAAAGKMNRNLASAARFINIHAENSVRWKT